MVETLEEAIAKAKEQKDKADALDAMRELDDEGLLGGSGGSEKREDSAFAKSAVAVIHAQHDTKDENVIQTHSQYKENLIAPRIEIAIIQESIKKENALMVANKTVDQITELENLMVQQEVDEMGRDLDRLMVSVDGRGRDDANQNVGALVVGENMERMAQLQANFGMMPQQGPGGFVGRVKKFFGGSKKK